jgi:hypothetical protein
MELELIHGDRRADRRHEFALDLRFSYRQGGQIRWGSGRTSDLSRSGVRFLTESPTPDGVEVEMRIQWPFLLQNVIPLELVMRGTMLGTDSRGTVLRVRSYAFRTCGERSFHQDTAPERSCSLTA